MRGEEEREQLRGKEGYKRMKRENKSDNDPKCVLNISLFFFLFFFTFGTGEREKRAGSRRLLMHCSQQRESKSF